MKIIVVHPRKPRKITDLTDKTYNLLTVTGRDTSRKSVKNFYWWRDCACGGRKSVKASHLKDGEVKSCGCLSAPIPRPGMPAVPRAIRLPRPPRKVTTEQPRAMVNGFLTSGFTRAEAEEMAGMGTVLIREEAAA